MYQASTEVADGMDIPGSRVVGVPMGSPLAVQKPLSWSGPRTTIWFQSRAC